MKRINHYKKLFEIEGPIELGSLKNTYRRLVKQWHPVNSKKTTPCMLKRLSWDVK